MLPDLSVFWVVSLLLILAVILDRLIFRPILQVVKKREDAVSSAQALAEQASREAREAVTEFDRETQAARAGIYKQMDEMRQIVLTERAALLAATKQEVESSLAEARGRLAQDVATAKAGLAADAEALAVEATTQILGRRPS
jgi:F-type H+-transporting ATPase subunit b